MNFTASQAGSGVCVVGVGDIHEAFDLDYDALPRVEPSRPLHADAFLRDGDLLLVRSSGSRALVGRCTLVRNPPAQVTHTGFTIRAVANTSVLDPAYLLYFLRSGKAKTELKQLVGGSNISNLSQEILRNLMIPLPPIDDQRRIAMFLRSLDDRQLQVLKLLKVKRLRRRGLMQQAFERTDAWRQADLGEFFVQRRERNRGESELILSCTKRGLVAQTERFKKRLASRSLEHYKIVRQGDLVYDPMLLWDGSYGFLTRYEVGVASPAYSVLAPTQPQATYFLRALLETPKIRHAFKAISKGTNQRRRKADVKDFLGLSVDIPVDDSDQQAIGKLYASLESEIELLQRLEMSFQRQKMALLDKLLSGELRLPAT